MWRRLMVRCHPDPGGTGDLVAGVRQRQRQDVGARDPSRTENAPPRRTTTADSPRLDFTDAFKKAGSFEDLTRQAVALAETLEEPYASVLKLLGDLVEIPEVAGPLHR